MRKLMLSAFVALLTITSVFAQTGKDALNAAGKAYDKYALNQDEAKLQEAIDNISVAMQDDEVKANYKAYLEAGDIYGAAISYYVSQRVISNEAIEPMVEGAAAKAAMAYMKAYEITEKKGGKKAALKGLQELQGNISNEGIYAIQDKDYGASYQAFNTSIMVHDFLEENGGESVMTDQAKLNDERYYAALSAVLNEEYAAAEPLFLKLYEDGYEDSGLYDGLYKVYSGKGDLEKAGQYLTEGREKFPDETQLLFTEINYYLAQDKLDVLTSKLEEAIKAEPDNVSLYSTLGSVYDRLYQQTKEEDPDKAAEYFELAKDNYEAGLDKDEDNASVIYSLGALYFNRAASMTEELVELGNDFSKEGQKKYEALEAKINAEFDVAFPYFIDAEKADPSNLNTLIALKEIFARKDDFEASNEMKARMEKVQAGETIDKSYFEEKGM